MKRQFFFLIALLFATTPILAQDIIVKSNGDFIRVTITGTDFNTVKYTLENGTIEIGTIKNVKEFVWNGETFIQQTFFGKKKAEVKFVKILESGKVNLYSIGGILSRLEAPLSKPRISPSIGIGSGGMGGIGGSISIGGGSRSMEGPSAPVRSKLFLFIEKPGTGPIQEINYTDVNTTKTLLLQKIGDDEDLANRIKLTSAFDDKLVIAFIKAYNEVRK